LGEVENRVFSRQAAGEQLDSLTLVPLARRVTDDALKPGNRRLIASDVICIGKEGVAAAAGMPGGRSIKRNGHGETLSSDGHHTAHSDSTLAIRGQADDARIIALSVADLPGFVDFLVRQADVGGAYYFCTGSNRPRRGLDLTALLGGIVFVRQPALRHALNFERIDPRSAPD
jgi:hypothetical protein